MKLIIGLGNPGKEFELTRHNLGFLALDQIFNDQDFCFSKFSLDKKFSALVASGDYKKEKIILAKPQTFMNLSGKTVSALANYYKIKPENIWVIYDDIDLPLGKIRLRKSGSSGGHKGVQSIIDCLGNKNFARFRLGIKPEKISKKPLEKFVLEKFPPKEKILIKEAILKIKMAIILALERNLDQAISQYN